MVKTPVVAQPKALVAASYPHSPQEVEYRRCPVTHQLVLVFKGGTR